MFRSLRFRLPALFLAAPAGFLADRFSKRQVMVGCKIAEILPVDYKAMLKDGKVNEVDASPKAPEAQVSGGT